MPCSWLGLLRSRHRAAPEAARADKWQQFIQRNGLPEMEEALLRQAFSHPSYVREQGQPPATSNQRLEFLGDGVVDLVIAEYLFERYPQEPEGELTRRKAALVRRTALAEIAREIGLGEMLLLGKGEEETGGREKASLLADALEALIGAIYLAGGWSAARQFVLTWFAPLLEQEAHAVDFDHKSRLQEIIQSRAKALPGYETVRVTGPPHRRVFVAEVRFRGRVLGEGQGPSKRLAEQRAALDALERREEWLPMLGEEEGAPRNGETNT